jgi:hypothetical protein
MADGCTALENRDSKPVQIYSETKSLLFSIIKSLPKLENHNEVAEINVVLDMADEVRQFLRS